MYSGNCLYYLVHFQIYAYCKYVHAVILVGGFNPSEKISQLGIWIDGKIKKCSKPPTRYI